MEDSLVTHIENFLLELGAGFAFVGRQLPLEVGDGEYFIDLLFYHLRLHCYVVIDLKIGGFKPEYAGKMNFYLSAVDDLLRDAERDGPTLGLLLCREKNKIAAEYARRDINKPLAVAEWTTQLTRSLPKELQSQLPTFEQIESELSEELEPTNNHSEQQIRHCVIDRRITQGTRSEAGQRYHERMWSVIRVDFCPVGTS